MNSTNRVLNRTLILVTGLVCAGIVALAIRPEWLERGLESLRGVRDRVDSQRIIGLESIPPSMMIAVAAAAVIVVLLVWFIVARGGGRTSTVRHTKRNLGEVAVDRTVADAVLAQPLRERADVLSARLATFRVRGVHTIRVTVRPRRGADLGSVLRAGERAVAEWDALAGEQDPVVLYVADHRIRGAWSHEARVS